MLEKEYVSQNDETSFLFTQQLYDKFEKCEDVGVINHERI